MVLDLVLPIWYLDNRLIRWHSNHSGAGTHRGNSAMKMLTASVMLVAFGLAPAWASAQDRKSASAGAEGNWEGVLKAAPQIELRITLEIAKGKDGSLSGTWGSPDEGLSKLPLTSIALKDGVLTFKTNHGVA